MPQFYDALPTDYLAPGETMTVSVDGFPIAVANVDGEYFALAIRQSRGGRRYDDTGDLGRAQWGWADTADLGRHRCWRDGHSGYVGCWRWWRRGRGRGGSGRGRAG